MWWGVWVGVAAAATTHAGLASSSLSAASSSSPWLTHTTPLSPVLAHQLPPPAASRRRNSVGMRAMRSSLEPLTAVSEANQEELTPEHSQQVCVCVWLGCLLSLTEPFPLLCESGV
jgi:hypothetical protein